MEVGFLGIGVMGQPMALNMARSGVKLVVWNRTREKARALVDAGASLVDTVDDVFARAETVVMMLANREAIDQVLRRGTPGFAFLVRGKTIVHMGTTAPEYSHSLEKDILAAGGSYVEAPVSGSRKPAENAQLVGMLAGESEAVERVRAHIAPTCRQQFICGPVPSALRMKLSVNLFLITLVAGLAEAFNFAYEYGLDLQQFREVLDSGPMSSSVSKMKLEKLVAGNFDVQAAIDDVLMNSNLVAQAARQARVASPLLDESRALFQLTSDLGRGGQDMAAVFFAIAERTNQARAG